MIRYFSIALLSGLWLTQLEAQSAEQPPTLQGVVVDAEKKALEAVNLYWLGSQITASTDRDGYFQIPRTPESQQLIISYVGYQNDTLSIGDQGMVEIQLANTIDLQEIVISHKQSGVSYSYLSPIRLQEIKKEELLMAACCNISESFETNATVDAAPTDAVTGTRQIKMLGLAGPYIQITRENMPDTRGLSSLQGLMYTPGSWVDAIQINTGTGSVTNGFEAITGQINIELAKPQTADPFYFNLYHNQAGRTEANLNLARKMSDSWSAALLVHGLYLGRQTDQNEDGFLDNPLARQFIALNRYKWQGTNGWVGQLGARYVHTDNEAGQWGQEQLREPWRSELSNRHLTLWGKAGKVLTNTSSFGLQVAGSRQDQQSRYGRRHFDARHTNLYANFIYQGILFWNYTHRYKVGASFQLDHFDEQVAGIDYRRRETVPGLFAEYTYDPTGKINLVAGLRTDYHNNYGIFVTPRLHLRYAPVESTVLRLAIGRGLRTANIFADNVALFASNRAIHIRETEENNPYGLRPEVAWTTGLSVSQRLSVFGKEVGVELDAYRTSFQDQVVVDYDASPQTVQFYNLEGDSYANNLQVGLSSQVHDRVELRMAYRFNEVQVDYQQGRLEQPYTSRHRAFWNVRYEDDKGWAFNYTLNWIGTMRLPGTASNPESFRMPTRSPHYTLSNIQVSKSWNKVFDLYLGAENLFGFRQERAILDATNPFSNYFDASMIWAPVFGRNIYAGIRWRLPSTNP